MKKLFVLAAMLLLLISACGITNYENDKAYAIESAEELFEEIEIAEEFVEEVEEDGVEEVLYIAPEPIFTKEPLPDHIIDLITGVSFHENTPFDYDALTYLTITYADFDDQSRVGHMIVAAEIGDEVLDIFRDIYAARFPIYQMRLIDYFGADDTASMDANNSHAFNFRYIAGTDVISRHGFGMAIDINPIQNPYLRGSNIQPAAGKPYLDRENVRPGMIVPGDLVHTAFISRGWIWGGDWTTLLDFHHFEKPH